MRKGSAIKAIEAFVRSQKEMPHMTFVSILIGVGVSAVTLLIMATLDGGLFGQEAEAATKARSTKSTGGK
jgi:hypothetical protein